MMENSSKKLNELSLNLAGKLFIGAVGAWLVGKYVNTKLMGSPEEIEAVKNAMISSRRFQDELKRPGATIQSVMNKLKVKDMNAKTFENTFGIRWPF